MKDTPSPALSRRKFPLWLEFALIFAGVPLLLLAIKQRWALFALLWVGALITYFFMRRKGGKMPERPAVDLRRQIIPVAIRFAVLAPAIALLTWLALPDAFLSLPRTQPYFWLAIMILYPVLSVWPQEMLYRAFLHQRYAALFGTRLGYVAASALSFGYAHIIFLNWIAVGMSVIGGYIFASDYARHKSLRLVCLEHALYGCLIFTVGLGRFFYTGAVWH